MNRRLLLSFVPLLLLGAAPSKKPDAPKTAELAVELTFLEFATREKVAQETIVLSLDAKNAERVLAAKGGLAGWKVRTLAREVKVNDKAEGYWVEMTLLGADGAEAGYLSAILPRDPAAAFSASTKVKAGKVPLNAVLTRAP